MKNIMNTYHDYPEETRRAADNIKKVMKMRKEEEVHKFPFKKKGFRKHVK